MLPSGNAPLDSGSKEMSAESQTDSTNCLGGQNPLYSALLFSLILPQFSCLPDAGILRTPDGDYVAGYRGNQNVKG